MKNKSKKEKTIGQDKEKEKTGKKVKEVKEESIEKAGKKIKEESIEKAGKKDKEKSRVKPGSKNKGRDKGSSGNKGRDKAASKNKGHDKAGSVKYGTGRIPYHNTKHLFGTKMTEQLDHGRKVSSLAYEVGRELGLSDDACMDLIIAGFFHDIGKTELAEAEKGKSTLLVEEMNSVRLHPRVGYDILKRHGFSDEICRDVLYHHENMDGSGYPENLEGSNIPLGACILRVCDVFCALTQDRPYRRAFPPEIAMQMMIEEVEKYNLKVFLAFQRVLHRSPDGRVTMPEVRPEVRGVWKKL
ncbi:MAG: HD-GYP domain-containing protein [Bilifractor sp.]